ncbi:hypothetical protein JCM16358_04410 [Halanaerocella petrolearia]
MKTPPQDLVAEIADELIIYLKAGKLNPNPFIKQINFQLENLTELLQVHFVLQQEVIDFIDQLPQQLNRIKGSWQQVDQLLTREIKGRVNWQQTIKERYKTSCNSQNRFVCQEKNKDYNLKENIVLKKLLNIIVTILDDVISIREGDYKWLADWIGDKGIYQQFKEVYLNNSYLKQIKQDQIEVTDRMINNVKQSRRPFYRRAANLLSLYQSLINYNSWDEDIEEEVIELLQQTFIQPDKVEILFELYWVLRLLKSETEEASLQLLQPDNSLVASWKQDSKEYSLYHDATGSKRLSWQVSLQEVTDSDNNYLKQKVAAYKKRRKLAREFFGSQITDSYWSGRPDIILEVVDATTNKLDRVVIGEVKYTAKKSTARQGLKELLDYIALIKTEDDYFNNQKLDKEKVQGLLLLDDVKLEKSGLENINLYNKKDKLELFL